MVYTSISVSLASPWTLPTTSTKTTLHTTTSSKTSSTAVVLQDLTGAYTGLSSSTTTPLDQITGAYTALTTASTGTAEAGVFTLVTYNGGLCQQQVTGSSTLITYGSYVAGTTLAYVAATTLARRNTATYYSITTAAGTPTTTAGLPVGTTAVPVADVPYCAAVTATGAYTAPLVSSGETTEETANHTLSTGQKAGIAIGVVAAVVIAIVAIGGLFHKRGRWRQGTKASRNIWGAEDAAGGPSMTQGNTMVSGMGLRDVLYSGRHVSGRG